MKNFITKVLAFIVVSIGSKAAFAELGNQKNELIDDLKNNMADRTLSADDKIRIIENLSIEEKESIIIQLLNSSNRGIQLENSERVLDIDHLRDVAAKSFKT